MDRGPGRRRARAVRPKGRGRSTETRRTRAETIALHAPSDRQRPHNHRHLFLFAEIALRGAYFVRNSMVPLRAVALRRRRRVRSDAAVARCSADSPERQDADLEERAQRPADLPRRLQPGSREQDGSRCCALHPDRAGRVPQQPDMDIRINSEGTAATRCRPLHSPRPFALPASAIRGRSGCRSVRIRRIPAGLPHGCIRSSPVRYEVQNFGVLGYSSFQGLQLLKTRVFDYHPDIVVIGFGMNDSEVAGYRDKDMVGRKNRRRVRLKSRATPREHLESYKLLKYEALVLRFRPKPVGDYLKARPTRGRGRRLRRHGAVDARVAAGLRANIREMIRLAGEHGAWVVLVDNELWKGSPYRSVLRRSRTRPARRWSTAWRSSTMRAAVIERASRRGSISPAGLIPAPARGTDDRRLPRFYGSVAVPKTLSIVGADPQLGALGPTRSRCATMGAKGISERATACGAAAAFAPEKTVSYMYTNSGAAGSGKGLDVPHVREVTIPARPTAVPSTCRSTPSGASTCRRTAGTPTRSAMT